MAEVLIRFGTRHGVSARVVKLKACGLLSDRDRSYDRY